MSKYIFVLILSVVFCFSTACDLAKPQKRRDADAGHGFNETAKQLREDSKAETEKTSGKTRYLEVREKFKTKLIRKGPAPQEADGDQPGRFVHEISYPSEGRNLKGWVYIPDDDQATRRPALIFCHGGFAADANDMLCVAPFVNGDYIIMGPAWRGESGNPGDFELMLGEVDDAANAARWLAKQPYVDPDHIYMFGHSIGAGISALVSLLDDVPIRHSGGSGGLYFPQFFEAWKDDTTPFDYRNKKECGMRILVDNTDFMLRKHYAYIGNEDEPFVPVVKFYQSGKVSAPLLHTELVSGDHFTSFSEAVQRYFNVVEKDRVR